MKKAMVTILTIVCCLATALAFAACGGNGGFDAAQEIILVQREAGSGTRNAFEELFEIKDQVHASAAALSSTGAVRTKIASDEYAIGYVSAASVDESVKALSMDGVAYSAENVQNGTYKVARPFLMIVKAGTQLSDMSAQARDFYTFVMSVQGQKIITDDGLVGATAQDGASGGNYTAPETALNGKVVVTGSTSVQPVMNKLAEAYKKLNTGVEITVDGTGSGDGRTAIDNGTADFGIVSAALSASHAEKYAALKIATDGVCVIVNKNNPTDNLKKDQVQKIFKGETLTWSQVA